MSDDDLYTLVRVEFEPVRLPPHRLYDITARGRGLRRRRRAAKAVAAATSLHFVIFVEVSDHRTQLRSVQMSLVHGDPVPGNLLE